MGPLPKYPFATKKNWRNRCTIWSNCEKVRVRQRKAAACANAARGMCRSVIGPRLVPTTARQNYFLQTPCVAATRLTLYV